MWRTRIWARASYCVVEMHADVGRAACPDYAVIKLSRHIVQGERPDTIVRGIDRGHPGAAGGV